MNCLKSHVTAVKLTTSLNIFPVRPVCEELVVVHGEQVALQPVGVAEGLRAERAEEQPRAGRPQRGDGRLAQLLGGPSTYDIHSDAKIGPKIC